MGFVSVAVVVVGVMAVVEDVVFFTPLLLLLLVLLLFVPCFLIDVAVVIICSSIWRGSDGHRSI